MSEKLDLFRQHKDQYIASKKTPKIVAVRKAQYLTIEGRGEPGGEAFVAAASGLYSVALTIKMTRKFSGRGDYKVAPLEGLWWGDVNCREDLAKLPRDQWRWKLLIRTPDVVGKLDLASAKDSLRSKNKPPKFEQVKLESIEEGKCVQMLHVGPYANEVDTLDAMEQFAADNNLEINGLHHEVYLSDPRRTEPERLKTILRLPVSAT